MVLSLISNLILLIFILQSELQGTSSISASITKSWSDILSIEISTWTSVLIRIEAYEIFCNLNITSVIELIDVLPSDIPASKQSGLESEIVNEALKSLSNFIFSSSFGLKLEKLINHDIREEVTQGVISNIAKGYQTVNDLFNFFFRF